MAENIFGAISEEIKDFTDVDIEIVDGYMFNQYDTIKRCHLYYNSQFEDNSEYNGREKIFFNISKYRCMAATKLMDFDTKDIRLWPTNPSSEIGTFLLEKELKLWLKKNKIANVLNTIAEELPVYGSSVLKKVDDRAEVTDLRRLFLDPTVETIQDSRFIIQKHLLTASQLRAKAGEWDNIEDVIEKFATNITESYEDNEFQNTQETSPYYVIYERYGEVPESWIKDGGDPDKMVRSIYITTDPDMAEDDSEGIVLFKSEWSGEYPFKDVHYSKTRGRWLGVGVIEDLFPAQERQNELANQKRIAMEVSSMVLFQTSDNSVLKNVLKDKKSGDIIRKSIGGEGLQAVDNRIKNFGEFQAEYQQYDVLADRVSFANDVVRGGEISASTPATNALIQNSNSTSVFLYKRENFGNMIRDFFNEFVLSQLMKDLKKEHILRFTGSTEELAKVDMLIADAVTRNKLVDAMLSGKLVGEEDKERIKSEALKALKKKGENRFLTLKKDFYKDLEFEFDFMVNNEQENVGLLMQNTFAVMTALAQNPGMLNDPRIKALFYQYMEKAGISPGKLELAEAQAAQGLGQIEQLAQAIGQAQQAGPVTPDQANPLPVQ